MLKAMDSQSGNDHSIATTSGRARRATASPSRNRCAVIVRRCTSPPGATRANRMTMRPARSGSPATRNTNASATTAPMPNTVAPPFNVASNPRVGHLYLRVEYQDTHREDQYDGAEIEQALDHDRRKRCGRTQTLASCQGKRPQHLADASRHHCICSKPHDRGTKRGAETCPPDRP